MVFSWLLRGISTVIGTLIPAYYTFKTLKRPNQRAQAYWLKYWVVFGMTTAVEFGMETSLLPYLIPGYDLLRLGYFVWAVNPLTQGAQTIYDKALRPALTRRERQLDAVRGEMLAAVANLAYSTAASAAMVVQQTVAAQFPGLLAAPRIRDFNAVRIEELIDEDEVDEFLDLGVSGSLRGTSNNDVLANRPLCVPNQDYSDVVVKEEPPDSSDSDEIEILNSNQKGVKQPKKAAKSTMKKGQTEEDSDGDEENDPPSEHSSGDDDYMPPGVRTRASSQQRGRGRGGASQGTRRGNSKQRGAKSRL